MRISPIGRRLGRRWVALAAVVALLVLAVGFQVVALTGSAFEGADGNLTPASGTDWSNAPSRQAGIDLPTGQHDDALGQGSKEDDEVPTVVDGSIPNNKSDLTRFYVANEKAGGDDFLYLAWERVQDPNGTTNVDFEFNQSAAVTANGITHARTTGDLLITYDIDRGGTAVAIGVRKWTGSEWSASTDLTALGAAEGWFNTAPVVDPIAPDAPRTLSPRTFAEAAINLSVSGLFPRQACVSYGSAFVKSRSSDAFNAELKDFIAPIPVTVSNCGTIIVRKDAVPNDVTDFNFTTSGAGMQAFALDDDGTEDNELSSSRTFVNLLAGSYTVAETASSTFDLTGIACTATAGSSGARSTVDTTQANISLGAGGTVDCTFTNTRKPAVLQVIKHVVNDDGGSVAAGDFTIAVSDPGTDPAPFQGDEAGTSVTVDPGEYSVTETGGPSGYAASYSSDCSGSIAAGETRTCTITNDDIKPKLLVIKHVVNDNGGTEAAADFTMDVDGTGVAPARFAGSGSGTSVALDAGSYSVTESGPSGYAGAMSEACAGTIGVGETRTCTVTNNDAPPGLTVIKHVVNDNGGTATAADFSISVDGAAPVPSSFSGSEAGTKVSLNSGSYGVTEAAAPGYKATYSEDCTGTISVGEAKVCTITNDDIQPKLTVTKHVVNDNGGTASAGDFTMTVDATGASPAGFPGDEDGTSVALNAGAYSVSESGPSGYVGTMSAGCSGTIVIGQTLTCTITNNDAPPGLTVIKHVVNDNGGTKVAGDFSISVDGAAADPASFAGSEKGTLVSLHSGPYGVTEAAAPGYTATYSDDCTGTISVGEAKVCTITNDDIQPKLVVIKHVVNDNGGSKVAGDFTMDVDGNAAAPSEFAGSEEGTTVALDAGSYSVSETGPGGYIGTLSEDCSGTIAVGETRACTITNNDAPPGLTVIKHVVNDNGGTADAGDFMIKVSGTGVSPATFAGTEEGTNVPLTAGAYEVTEVEAAGYAATYSVDCTGTIAVGQAKVCTITNDDIQPKLVVIKHVVNDNGGNLTAADFTMNVTGTITTSFPGSETGTTVRLNAGRFDVDETDAGAAYAKTLSGDCSGTIAVGESRTCTITNDDVVEVRAELIAALPTTGMAIAALAGVGLTLLLAGLIVGRIRRRTQRI